MSTGQSPAAITPVDDQRSTDRRALVHREPLRLVRTAAEPLKQRPAKLLRAGTVSTPSAAPPLDRIAMWLVGLSLAGAFLWLLSLATNLFDSFQVALIVVMTVSLPILVCIARVVSPKPGRSAY